MLTIPTEKRRLDFRRRAAQDFAEIFAVELGQTINQDVLHSLASEPKQEYVFNINGFKDVKDGVVDVADRLIDNGKCGKQHRKELLSGPPKTLIEPTRQSYNYNYVPHRNEMRQGELPWVGWIGARGKLCGGALLCERFFLTAARCVSEFNETTNELVPYPPHEVTVNLGDLNLYENDKHEQTLNPERIILHPYYTGLSNINGIRHHDVAVLDFGKSHVRKPALNSFVKPICFPYHNLHNVSATLLSDFKQLKPTLALGFTAGWGLMPEHHRQLPWDVLSQSRRSVQSDRVCERLYPGLDTDRFFCVGNFIQEIETCRGDVGGVYMAELPYLGRYSALGVNIRSFDYERDGHFSMFLNLHHPEITGWMESVLGRCNRMGTVEEEEAEAEKERMQNEEAERLATDKARKERERLAAEKVRKEEKERLADKKERG
ncbi:transmembrane protease serine 12-like [Dreissena polymorpha]|uniref:transmembrane protease serine 12-like n=1 Tax=Dreissena polymorpha TaxID=45954 RepID=UPI002264980F|nr:transmembrane protease serine 12-like [Dreissena polymorpha]